MFSLPDLIQLVQYNNIFMLSLVGFQCHIDLKSKNVCFPLVGIVICYVGFREKYGTYKQNSDE
jgi:hypothetical protein